MQDCRLASTLTLRTSPRAKAAQASELVSQQITFDSSDQDHAISPASPLTDLLASHSSPPWTNGAETSEASSAHKTSAVSQVSNPRTTGSPESTGVDLVTSSSQTRAANCTFAALLSRLSARTAALVRSTSPYQLPARDRRLSNVVIHD